MNLEARQNQKKLTAGLLLIYLVVLSWIILLKMEFDITILKNMNFRSVNANTVL